MTKKHHAPAGQPVTETAPESIELTARPNLSFGEFVPLMALLMSLAALSIDAILPGLKALGPELGHTAPQELQQVVTLLFGGLAVGQLLYGPLSDQTGRKPAIYLGLVLFIVGSLMSWAAQSFEVLLIGRFLQGFGIAGPRVVMVALVRDLFAGRGMARIMSFIMGVFIFVPTIAPMMGQAVYLLAGWRAIFFSFILLALIGGIWLGLRQQETLLPHKRIKLSLGSYLSGTLEVFRTPSCVGYMILAGLVSGPFITYLGTAQNLFQATYQVGEAFPFFFAGLALSIGIASFVNSQLVMKFGMRPLARIALIGMFLLSSSSLAISAGFGFVPPIWLLMLLYSPLFFCIGLLFGNLNALAMEEVGHIAGMASAWVGAFSTLVGIGLATLLGYFYDGTILALGIGFMICSLLCLVIMALTEKAKARMSAKAV